MTGDITSEIDGIELETGTGAELSVIWLHGLGADGADFLPIVDELDLPCATRFIFPHAPRRPITINGGMVMRGWYDIAGFSAQSPIDRSGLSASAAFVETLIARELDRGQRRETIVLAGFSQGGAVVLQTALAAGVEPIGGVMALSTYLPAPDLLGPPEAITRTVPVFMAHGTVDPVIPLIAAQSAAEWLAARGVPVDWHTYAMGHEVSRGEIDDLGSWLRRFRAR